MNHRFLDLQLRLPPGLDALEMELRRALKESLVRGHVELTLSVDRSLQQKAGYNSELVAGYLDAFKQARAEFQMKGEPDLNVALRLPGALQAEARSTGEEDLAALTESAMREIGPLLAELRNDARPGRRGAGGDSAGMPGSACGGGRGSCDAAAGGGAALPGAAYTTAHRGHGERV